MTSLELMLFDALIEPPDQDKRPNQFNYELKWSNDEGQASERLK